LAPASQPTAVQRQETANKPASQLLPEELERLAMYDSETDAYNLRYMVKRLGYEIERIRIFGGNVAVMVVSVDDLRNIGMEYGQGGLDRVIGTVSALLINGLRPVDLTGRLNEDRFVVVCPGMANEDLDKLANDLCRAYNSIEIKHQWHAFKFTVSIGISVSSTEICDAESLLALADMNADDATAAGGNAVCFEG
jgi:diguanylate cyclase (GGDEF)-like protein